MSFIDNISKKINDTTDRIVIKTKEIKDTTVSNTKAKADTAKLKSKKKAIEKEIEDLYCQLGKAYYIKNGDKCGELVAAINEEIDKYNKVDILLADFDGLKKCLNCGAKVSKDSVFCNNCGTKFEEVNNEETGSIEETEAENKKICPKCETELPDWAGFCTKCGTKYN